MGTYVIVCSKAGATLALKAQKNPTRKGIDMKKARYAKTEQDNEVKYGFIASFEHEQDHARVRTYICEHGLVYVPNICVNYMPELMNIFNSQFLVFD